MPSVETQTAWSWIQDMLLIARYKDIGNECFPLLSNAQSSNSNTPRERPHSEITDGLVSESEGPDNTVPVPTDDKELHLPLLHQPEGGATPLAELENLCFSSDSSEDDEGAGAERLPEINTRGIPLPAVLQYLRESEALASKYFSLSANHKSKRKPRQRNPTHPPANVQTVAFDSSNREAVMVACDFCGKKIPRLSLLGSLADSAEITSFCCDDYREFNILVAASTRQMLKNGAHSKVKGIKISSDRKSTKVQKTAEERALAMMIRKRKWEEQKVKFLQSTSFHSLTKHTKTIEFSLLSPGILETGWMVSPQAQDEATRTPNKAQAKGHIPKLLPGNIEITHPTKLAPITPNPPPPPAVKGPLKVQQYPNGRPFTTILPDMTGQCYYNSGRIAILIYAISQGILGYLVFEDDDRHLVLATLEDSGRMTCCNPNGTTKLVITPYQGTIFDDNQSVKRKWTWMGGANPALLQPISLQLNKAITIRCSNQDCIVLSFAADNSHIQFSTSRGQAQPGLRLEDQADLKNEDAVEGNLSNTKARISELLGKLQHTQRLRRTRQC